MNRDRRQELLHQISDVAHDLPRFALAPLFRRRHLRWGSTDDEVAASMFGDALIRDAEFIATRAVNIAAPPSDVWPWLVQMGCLRAGWYSDDLLDNLSHPSATAILPELQHIEIGQWVPMSHTATPTDRTALRVDSFEADRWLLWTKPGCSWIWQLTPTADDGTRLVTRIRTVRDPRPLDWIIGVVLMEFGDFAMMRRTLLNIKSRAEAMNSLPDARAFVAVP